MIGVLEEFVLGYYIYLSIEFVVLLKLFLFILNTCSNALKLLRFIVDMLLLVYIDFFKFYDYGFFNLYFGLF